MKYYAVAELDVTDPAWVREYVATVTPMVERHGGRYLARTTKVERIEGERPAPQVSMLIEWPSKEAADAFYESEEYAPFREARIDGARNEFLLVAGEDVNGVAQIPGLGATLRPRGPGARTRLSTASSSQPIGARGRWVARGYDHAPPRRRHHRTPARSRAAGRLRSRAGPMSETETMSSQAAYDPETIARGAEALLREHPDALVAGLASNGLIVPVPQIGRALGPGPDRGPRRVRQRRRGRPQHGRAAVGATSGRRAPSPARCACCASPSSWMTLHFIDLREVHGIVLAVILPSEEPGAEEAEERAPSRSRAAPRFCTLTEDEGAQRDRLRRGVHARCSATRSRRCTANPCSTRSTPTTRAARSRAG